MRRYQVRSTLMTSNRPLEDWGKLIGDVLSATAILDRFLHNAEVITITGRSYRLKDRAGTIATPNAPEDKNEPACTAAGNEHHAHDWPVLTRSTLAGFYTLGDRHVVSAFWTSSRQITHKIIPATMAPPVRCIIHMSPPVEESVQKGGTQDPWPMWAVDDNRRLPGDRCKAKRVSQSQSKANIPRQIIPVIRRLWVITKLCEERSTCSHERRF